VGIVDGFMKGGLLREGCVKSGWETSGLKTEEERVRKNLSEMLSVRSIRE